MNYKMWINGEWMDADSGRTYPVINPANGEEIAQVPLGGKTDVEKAVAAAKNAFPAWSGKSQAERSAIVNTIGQAIRENVEELAMLDCLDHGTPITTARKITRILGRNFIG